MKISHRLYVAIAPAVIGVFTVAGLAYWGRYARQVPELVVALAVAAAVLSFLVAWSNARFLARRIEGLAGASAQARARVLAVLEDRDNDPGPISGAPVGKAALRDVAAAVAPEHVASRDDEIDEIQQAVERLTRAVDVAESERASTERREDQRVRDHARLLLAVVEEATRRLDDVRLPLHILLDNHFGDLNENQEEMLGAARDAAEAIDTELVGLQRIAQLDLGTSPGRRDRVRASDIVEAILPLLAAAAQARGVSLRSEIAPLLPAITVDRTQLQEALTTLFRNAIAVAEPEADLVLRVDLVAERATGGHVEIVLTGTLLPLPAAPTISTALARRILIANGGTVETQPSRVQVILGSAGAIRAQHVVE